MTFPHKRTHTHTQSLEEEWEYKNRERLINTVLHANRLVQEANMLAHELNKETVFKVTLTVRHSVVQSPGLSPPFLPSFLLSPPSSSLLLSSLFPISFLPSFSSPSSFLFFLSPHFIPICPTPSFSSSSLLSTFYSFLPTQVPRSFLSPRKMKSDDMSTSNEVAIRVLHKQRGTDSVWSLDQLEEKVLTMRDMYQRMEEEGRGVPMLVGLFATACQN